MPRPYPLILFTLLIILAGLVGCNGSFDPDSLKPNLVSSGTTTPPPTTDIKSSKVRLELLYPAGVSPKIFQTGWVFGAKCLVYPGTKDQMDITERVRWVGEAHFQPDEGKLTHPTFINTGKNVFFLEVRWADEFVRQTYTVDVVSPVGYVHVGDNAFCLSDAHGCPSCAHQVVGPIQTGSPNVTINGLPAARVGDKGIHFACCGPNTFEIVSGDSGVLIDGKPAARMGDTTQHCGGTGHIGVNPPSPSVSATPTKTTPLPSTTPSTASPTAVTSRPVVDSITGSVTIADYGQQSVTVHVSGGKQPYYYEFVGNEPVLSESLGGNAIQIALKKSQFKFDGQTYSISVTVKDVNGQYASWRDAGGATKTKFTFGYKYAAGTKDAAGKWLTQPGWVVFTEPKFPYQNP